MSTLNEFAQRRRLRTKRDLDGTEIIPGKLGDIYEYDTGELGVIFATPAARPARTRLWGNLRRRCLAAGMTLRQSGDAEGAFSFNPGDLNQVRLAIQVAKVKPKRVLSKLQQEHCIAALKRARASQGRHLSALGRVAGHGVGLGAQPAIAEAKCRPKRPVSAVALQNLEVAGHRVGSGDGCSETLPVSAPVTDGRATAGKSV